MSGKGESEQPLVPTCTVFINFFCVGDTKKSAEKKPAEKKPAEKKGQKDVSLSSVCEHLHLLL